MVGWPGGYSDMCVCLSVCLSVCVCVACNVAVAHLTVYILPEAAVTAACHVTSLNRSAATVPRTSFFAVRAGVNLLHAMLAAK